MASSRRLSTFTTTKKLVIEDEADFLHKVRNKYLQKRNDQAATKIQSLARSFLVRCWYRPYYAERRGAAVMLQKNVRMILYRRRFLDHLDATKCDAATRIQKYLKGFLTHRKYKEVLHETVIARLRQHFRELKLKLHTDAQIKIRFAWRLHKRRKTLKTAKQKKKEAELKAKKTKKLKNDLRDAFMRQVT